jgi:hypothetical protein
MGAIVPDLLLRWLWLHNKVLIGLNGLFRDARTSLYNNRSNYRTNPIRRWGRGIDAKRTYPVPRRSRRAKSRCGAARSYICVSIVVGAGRRWDKRVRREAIERQAAERAAAEAAEAAAQAARKAEEEA